MSVRKEAIIFFAGVEAFHTLAHIAINRMSTLPIHVGFDLTQQINLFAIIANALITLGLLWWASTLR